MRYGPCTYMLLCYLKFKSAGFNQPDNVLLITQDWTSVLLDALSGHPCLDRRLHNTRVLSVCDPGCPGASVENRVLGTSKRRLATSYKARGTLPGQLAVAARALPANHSPGPYVLANWSMANNR